MADDDVEVKFGGNVEDLKQAVQESKSLIGSLGASVKSFIGGIGSAFSDEFVGLFTTGAGLHELVEWSRHMAELGDEALRTSQILGITVEQVTDFQFAVTATGGKAGQAVQSMERLELAMEGGGKRTAQSAAAFKALGISTTDASGKTKGLEEIMDEIADRFKEAPDGPAKTAAAMALMGRAGVEMIPMLNRGAEGLRELRGEAKDAGYEMSGPVAASLSALSEQFSVFDMAMTGLSRSIFMVFTPAVSGIVSGLTSMVEWFNNSIGPGTILESLLGGISLGFISIIAGVEILIAALGQLWEFAVGAFNSIIDGALALNQVIEDIISGNWGHIGETLAKAWDDQVGDWQAANTKIESIAKTTTDNIRTMYRNLFAGPGLNLGLDDEKGKGKGIGNIGDILKGDQNAKAGDNIIKSAQQQVAALQATADAFGMAHDQALQYTMQLKLVNQLNAIAPGLAEKYVGVIGELSKKFAELTIQQEKAIVKQGVMMDLANGITGAFMSWIDGTETLGMAFIKLAIQIAEAVIEAVILAIVMTALGIPMAAGPAGGFFGLLFGGGKAQGGPMQPGTWYMAGERGPEPIYMPGAIAGGYGPNDKSGGGSTTIHFAPNVQALDATGVDRVLSRHLDKLTKMVSRHMSRNPSARPDW